MGNILTSSSFSWAIQVIPNSENQGGYIVDFRLPGKHKEARRLRSGEREKGKM